MSRISRLEQHERRERRLRLAFAAPHRALADELPLYVRHDGYATEDAADDTYTAAPVPYDSMWPWLGEIVLQQLNTSRYNREWEETLSCYAFDVGTVAWHYVTGLRTGGRQPEEAEYDRRQLGVFCRRALAAVTDVMGHKHPMATATRQEKEAGCVTRHSIWRIRHVVLDDAVVSALEHRNAAQLVKHMYGNHNFADMPILADMAEDAGCTDARLLAHLRGPGPHYRGCWAMEPFVYAHTGNLTRRGRARTVVA
jgi:hypothetical protein